MPIYEYECEKCGGIEEVIQKMSDKPLTRCKQCSGKLHRLVSQSAFHLKGTGWYVTDYANKSAKPTEKTAKKSDNTGSESKAPAASTNSSSGGNEG